MTTPTGVNPVIPTSFATQESEYRAKYLEEWDKDELSHFSKCAIWSWFIPLCIVMASILICIAEANYLPNTSLDTPLIAGICVTTMFIGVGGATGIGIWIGMQSDADAGRRAIRVTEIVNAKMQARFK